MCMAMPPTLPQNWLPSKQISFRVTWRYEKSAQVIREIVGHNQKQNENCSYGRKWTIKFFHY